MCQSHIFAMALMASVDDCLIDMADVHIEATKLGDESLPRLIGMALGRAACGECPDSDRGCSPYLCPMVTLR